MDEALAVVVSCDWPDCVIRRFGTQVEVATRLSESMVENYIRVRPGDLVTADFDESPPRPRYRWRRVTVVSRDDDRVNVRPARGPDPEATEAVPVGEQDPQLGDTVFLSRLGGEYVVFDIAVDGEPSELGRYEARMAAIRAAR